MDNKKKKISVNFVDFPKRDNPIGTHWIWHFLNVNYDVELSDKPDFLICSVFDYEAMKYDCVKIRYTIENYSADFNLYDYAIGYDHMDFGDRYLRMPWCNFYERVDELLLPKNAGETLAKKTDFCSFVVSSAMCDPIRERFFHELNKYKKVNSGGKYKNNIGGAVKDKNEFLLRHKFNIAFENSAQPGYTTEKIYDAMFAQSLPIYWGNPVIEKDVDTDSILLVRNNDDVERIIEEIIYLDNNDNAYIEKMSIPWIKDAKVLPSKEKMEGFLRAIFDQTPENARRIQKSTYFCNKHKDIYLLGAMFKKIKNMLVKLLMVFIPCRELRAKIKFKTNF